MRQPIDRNIEGLRGEIQMVTRMLISFKQMVHDISESNRRATETMVRLTWMMAVFAAATFVLSIVLIIGSF